MVGKNAADHDAHNTRIKPRANLARRKAPRNFTLGEHSSKRKKEEEEEELDFRNMEAMGWLGNGVEKEARTGIFARNFLGVCKVL